MLQHTTLFKSNFIVNLKSNRTDSAPKVASGKAPEVSREESAPRAPSQI